MSKPVRHILILSGVRIVPRQRSSCATIYRIWSIFSMILTRNSLKQLTCTYTVLRLF